MVRKQTAVVNQLVGEAEPLVEKDEPEYEGGLKLYQAQKGIPKNKRLMKLMQEPTLQQLVQRIELDVLADRKLSAKDRQAV